MNKWLKKCSIINHWRNLYLINQAFLGENIKVVKFKFVRHFKGSQFILFDLNHKIFCSRFAFFRIYSLPPICSRYDFWQKLANTGFPKEKNKATTVRLRSTASGLATLFFNTPGKNISTSFLRPPSLLCWDESRALLKCKATPLLILMNYQF